MSLSGKHGVLWPVSGVLLLAFIFSAAAVPTAFAQTDDSNAIRVRSNEVLVPVMVLDKARLAALRSMSPLAFTQEVSAGDFHMWNQIAVQGLTARDFRVLEDGQEQFIRKASKIPQSGPPLLRDSIGYFWNFLGVGGGIWNVPVSLESIAHGEMPSLSGYLVSYTPPPSASGRCHRISVKVPRPGVLVYSRREYCDTQLSAADPLKGTELGRKLASELASRASGKINLSLAAFAPLNSASEVPVQIYLHFPTKPLVRYGSDCSRAVTGTIGISGAIYTGTEKLVARFSDFASQGTDRDYSFGPLMALMPNGYAGQCIYAQPDRYQTEVSLPPGKYWIRAVIRAGKNFGRAEIPLIVERTDPHHLAISEIALVRRFRDITEESGSGTSLPSNLMPLIAKNFEVTPEADVEARRRDPFYFYLQVQEPNTSGKTSVRLRIVDAKTNTTVKEIKPIQAASYSNPGDLIVPIAGGIDISKLPKGSYQLQAQATDSTGASTPWRSAGFKVE